MSIIALPMVFVVVGARETRSQDTSPEFIKRAEAVSFFEALSANWCALENYDVSVVLQVFRADTSESLESETKMRFIVDHRRNRYLFVADGLYQTTRFTGEETEARTLAAFSLDAESREAWLRSPGLPKPVKLAGPSKGKLDVLGIVALSRFPDVRLIGSQPFPSTFSTMPIAEYFTQMFNASKDLSIESSANNRTGIVEVNLPGKVSRLDRHYLFDNDFWVPLQLKYMAGRRDGKLRMTKKESIEWKEFDGLQLPKKLLGERMVSTTRSKNSKVPELYEVSFAWAVVNDQESIPKWDATVLSDTQWLLKFVSGVQSHQETDGNGD